MEKMSAENTVDQQLAYNRRDLEAFLSFYSDEVEICDLTKSAPIAKGKEALRQLYAPLFSENKKIRCTVNNRIVMEPFVIDEECVTGISFFPDGIKIAAISQVEAGQIIKVWFTR